MKKEAQVAGRVSKCVAMEVVVRRCGCPESVKSRPDWHGNIVLPNGQREQCPNPRAVEDLGVVAFNHRNPLKRWLFDFRKNVLRQRIDLRSVMK